MRFFTFRKRLPGGVCVCGGGGGILFFNLNVAILNLKCADYYCVVNGISKSDAVNVFENADLTEGRGIL